MATSNEKDHTATWPPDQDAVELETWAHPGNGGVPRTALIRHPTAPFNRLVAIDEFEAVVEAAYEYLLLIKSEVGLQIPGKWLQALKRGASNPDFGWLPLEPEDRRSPLAFGSLRVDDVIEDRLVNRTVVLLATQLSDGQPIGSELGLRIVVDAPPDGSARGIRITGMSATLPNKPELDPVAALLRTRSLVEILIAIRADLAAFAAVRPDTLTIRGLRLAEAHSEKPYIEVRARALSVTREPNVQEPYEILAKLVPQDGSPATPQVNTVNRILLSSCSGAMHKMQDFPIDPASHAGSKLWRRRRPTRTQEQLAAELEDDILPQTLEIAGQFAVEQTWFVPGDHPPGVKTVSLATQLEIRSNDFTAVSTFHNLRELFRRFGLYGIPLGAYFRGARLPLHAFYRSGIRPGPGKDGQTVNGRVTPLPWTGQVDLLHSPQVEQPSLAMHLALAELPVRDRQQWNHKAGAHAKPLGFANDPRWIWHEAAHVLLMATLGELEFRFAHSMGDGLAAIIEDPVSLLATDALWRGATYPFVFAPRRHDRCVCDGWGWAGRIGRPLRLAPERNRLNPKGYLTEQILSTSLFRMYRCLGGDTHDSVAAAPDPSARRNASDYAVYLIMEAVRLLGDPRGVPASHAAQFAATLMDADERTIVCPTGDGAGRVGGTAHKAIRWAFEAQGMYAGQHNETAPGRPPPVDVYIADDRELIELFPFTDVTYGPGSYVPVSLDWAGLAEGSLAGRTPAWFSTGAMTESGGKLSVKVGNRGRNTAHGVAVRLWWHGWVANTKAPDWDRALWVPGAPTSIGDIPTGATVTAVGLDLPPGPGRHLVMAETFCAADRANIDTASGLAPSVVPVPLEHMVPLDNNLGLIVI